MSIAVLIPYNEAPPILFLKQYMMPNIKSITTLMNVAFFPLLMNWPETEVISLYEASVHNI